MGNICKESREFEQIYAESEVSEAPKFTSNQKKEDNNLQQSNRKESMELKETKKTHI